MPKPDGGWETSSYKSDQTPNWLKANFLSALRLLLSVGAKEQALY